MRGHTAYSCFPAALRTKLLKKLAKTITWPGPIRKTQLKEYDESAPIDQSNQIILVSTSFIGDIEGIVTRFYN